MTDADGGGAVVRVTSDVCYLVYVCLCVQCIISGGFNGWPHVQWPTRPLSKEAQEAPREVCSG